MKPRHGDDCARGQRPWELSNSNGQGPTPKKRAAARTSERDNDVEHVNVDRRNRTHIARELASTTNCKTATTRSNDPDTATLDGA